MTNSTTYSLSTLPPAFRSGMTGVVFCSGISLTATSLLLLTLAYKAWKDYRTSKNTDNRGPMRRDYSIHTQGYFWLLNLFIADFVQALGLVTVTDSLIKDSVHAGPICTMQGFLINSGDVASAIWSFIIAVHTFFLLAGGRKYRAWVAEKSTGGLTRWFICLAVWLFVLFIGTIGFGIEKATPNRGPFYDQAGAGWCWIGPEYYWERIFFHYIFLFIDMFALTILYCVLFFYIRTQLKNFRKGLSSSEVQSGSQELSTWQANLEAGEPSSPAHPKAIIQTTTVTVTTEDRPIPKRRNHMTTEAERAHKRMNQVALTLLSYPIAYICLTMPLSITRLSQFAGKEWGLTCIYIGACIFCCSGLVNVLLYTATRKGIISWGWLFKRGKSTKSGGRDSLGGESSQAPPPPYHPHFPGGSHHVRGMSDSTLHLPMSGVISTKPSAASMSVNTTHPVPVPPLPCATPGSFKSDHESELEFSDSEGYTTYKLGEN